MKVEPSEVWHTRCELLACKHCWPFRNTNHSNLWLGLWKKTSIGHCRTNDNATILGERVVKHVIDVSLQLWCMLLYCWHLTLLYDFYVFVAIICTHCKSQEWNKSTPETSEWIFLIINCNRATVLPWMPTFQIPFSVI